MDGIVQPEERPNGFQQHQKGSLSHPDTQQPSEKYYNTNDQALLDSVEINSSALQPLTNPGSVKRRRGRPRLHPPVLNIDDHCAYKSGISDPREFQLEKNRIAADRCRKRKKEYVAELTANASALSLRNESLKAEEIFLREEVLDLKNEVLRHGACGSWIIDQYIAQSANDRFSIKESPIGTLSRKDSTQTQCSTVATSLTGEVVSEEMTEYLCSQMSSNSSVEFEDYINPKLLRGCESISD